MCDQSVIMDVDFEVYFGVQVKLSTLGITWSALLEHYDQPEISVFFAEFPFGLVDGDWEADFPAGTENDVIAVFNETEPFLFFKTHRISKSYFFCPIDVRDGEEKYL